MEYLTYVIISVGDIEEYFDSFGLLGLCGKRCANLPQKVTMLGDESTYSYTFNANGTIATITTDDGYQTGVMTFSYK